MTHLPQIAAFTDQHFLIENREKQVRMATSVRLIGQKERAEELARMISGATATSRRQAGERAFKFYREPPIRIVSRLRPLR